MTDLFLLFVIVAGTGLALLLFAAAVGTWIDTKADRDPWLFPRNDARWSDEDDAA